MSPLQLRIVAYVATDDRGNEALFKDKTAANNYISKPYAHGMVDPLVKLADVEAMFDETFNQGET